MPSEKLPNPSRNNLVERREFLSSAATLAGASFVGATGSSLLESTANAAGFPDPAPPAMTPTVERKLARWQDQRWLLDAVINTVGPEWDQGRLGGLQAIPGGGADAAGLRARIHKFNDISREFARTAVRREKEARQYEKDGRTVAAREAYFLAAHLYAGAQWPIFENTPDNLLLNDKKNEMYGKYIKYADHEIRRVEVPFGGSGKTLPGYLHLPPNVSGRVPCVWSISGLDSNKEGGAGIYGDGLRERGIATLALEGPGQNECAIRGIYLTQTNWQEAGKVVLEWARSQKEIDPDKIALRGASLGSYLGTQVASIDSRLKGAALQAMAVEPTMHTAFSTASPSFKLRFMYYTGIETEAELDKFLQSWTLHGVAEKVKCPYLLVGGEDDQLSPVEYGLQLMDLLNSPKQMILYEGALHSVSGAPSTTNGPATGTFMADWFKDRFDGKPMPSKLMKVDSGGQIHDFKFEDSRKALSVSLLWQGGEGRAMNPEKPSMVQEP
ncbi:MAG TPA: alpha/beta hydrolase [Candidatus Saccharimonadales bacterium]|jgi:fermentation-respiration switch protein FrsA (DUF1100 family)|nr:alpha/beta hydrolase [Candidatus Saccharimonadales bacterium]